MSDQLSNTPRPSVGARPSVTARPPVAARPPMAPKSKPDSGPLRVAIGMSGIALASAIATALLAPADTAAGGSTAQTTVVLPAQPTPVVRHVTKFVQLLPGQTAPPQAVVKQAPVPTPRIVVVTTTQSGVAKP